ncbi:MAG: folate-binding protein YgfZ [Halioglobus sp.]|nr:folate-binding protein YgfZ [Halioglobus sp.]
MPNSHFSILPGEALLLITGPDTLTFLQGQTTCDTSTLDAAGTLHGVYCTPKGRVVCDFLLLPLGADRYALRMRRDIRASSAAVFGKYIVFSKADIDADKDTWRVGGLWGEDAAAVLQDVFGGCPQGMGQIHSGPGCAVVARDDEGTRFELFLEAPGSDEQITALEKSTAAGDEADWRALDIAAGIARIEAPLVDELVPQTVNYDRTGHISFTKGCYTGQEVVARLHYRGKSKRRGFATELATELATKIATTADGTDGLEPGTELFASTSSSSVGHLVNSAVTESGAYAFVSATLDGAEAGLHLARPDGPALSLVALPYSLDDEN